MFKKTLFSIALVALGSAIKLKGSKQGPEFLSENKKTSFYGLEGSHKNHEFSFLQEGYNKQQFLDDIALIDDSDLWAELPYGEEELQQEINTVQKSSSLILSEKLLAQSDALKEQCKKPKGFMKKMKCKILAFKARMQSKGHLVKALKFGKKLAKKARKAYRKAKRLAKRVNKIGKKDFGASDLEKMMRQSKKKHKKHKKHKKGKKGPQSPEDIVKDVSKSVAKQEKGLYEEGDDNEFFIDDSYYNQINFFDDGDDEELYDDSEEDLYEGDDDELYDDNDDDLYEGDDDELYEGDDDELYEGDDYELYDGNDDDDFQ